MAGISTALFSMLGLRILVELVIVLVVGYLVKRQVLDNEELHDLVARHIKRARMSLQELLASVLRWTGGGGIFG